MEENVEGEAVLTTEQALEGVKDALSGGEKEADRMNGDNAKVRTRRTQISPERANALLKMNTRNRKASPREAAKLAKIMKNGEWEYNGEAIKISRTGVILDGQHRLMACAASGVAFETLVVENLPDEVFSTLDQGRRRSGGDVLYMRGVKRYNLVSNACSALFLILKDQPIYGGITRVPAYGVDEIHKRHPDLETAVELIAEKMATVENDVVGVSQLATYYYVLDTIMKRADVAATLVEGLTIGAGLEKDDPIFLFREKINALSRGKGLMQGQDKTALLAKVVGMHLSGEKVEKKLNIPDTAGASYFGLVPGLEEAVKGLDPSFALADLDY